MKKEKFLLLNLLLVLVSSCETPHAPPKVETCIHNYDNSAECSDLRLPQSEQSYNKSELENYICTNPKDYESMYLYCSDLREKLVKCEKGLK
jgi:hypothetical protein